MRDWQIMDEWCQRQLAAIRTEIEERVAQGCDYDAPEHRMKIGQSQAFHRMRSFIHGTCNPPNDLA